MTQPAAANPPADKTRPGPILTGACGAGRHDSCAGGVRVPRGVHPCRCDCHPLRPPICLWCGRTELVDPQTFRCKDEQECDDRLQQRMRDNPTWQMLQECKTQSRGGATMPKLEAEPTDAIPRPRARKEKAGICQHCGGPTKGGLFQMGHDAQLKSELRKTATDGGLDERPRIEALAELVARAWPLPDGVDGLISQAESMVEEQGPDAVVQACTAARLSRLGVA